MSRLTERQSAGYDLIEMKGAWCDNYCGEQSKVTCRDCAIWKGMRYRCNSQNCESYKDYGARGISVCAEWNEDVNGFFRFLRWALENGYSSELTIDRIDNDGNYEPSNCRWTDWETQAGNRRKPEKVKNQYGVWDYKEPFKESED